MAKKNSDGSINYIHNDHLGSSSVITNQAGALVESTSYDPWGKVNSGGTEATSYYFVNNELVARKNNNGTFTYYHNDHLGSASILTDQTGAIVESTTYDPYGKVLLGGMQSKYQYTGQEKDSETGLNYYGARYYGSDVRRFTQPDTIIQDIYNPQMLNRYAYAANNPLKYIDPSGHAIIYEDGRLQSDIPALSYMIPQKKKTTPAITTNLVTYLTNPNNQIKQSDTNNSSQSSKSVIGSNTASFTNNDINTKGLCLNGSAGLIVYYTCSTCIIYSKIENKFGITGSMGKGLTSGVTLDVGASLQFSNAKKFSDLLGKDKSLGGSVGEGVQGSLDVSFDNVNSVTIDMGLGVGGKASLPSIPAEVHGVVTNTDGFYLNR